MTREKRAIERNYNATLVELWEMWTTKEGIESWWGPEGFEVAVSRLDLRPAGTMAYTMTAVGPDQIGFMKQHGMPVTTAHEITYTEVTPERRLGWSAAVDFTEVPKYTIENLVEMFETATGVRLVLSFDPMHNDVWNGRMVAGWESELDKLGRRVQK